MTSEPPLDRQALAAFSEAVGEDGIPRKYVRVVDVDIAEDRHAALVLSLLNPDGDPYPMISFCESYDGVWAELVMTEAGDAGTNWAGERWVAYISGEAPEGAATVTVSHGDLTRQRSVVDGLFVVAFWLRRGGPDLEPDPPRLVGFD